MGPSNDDDGCFFAALCVAIFAVGIFVLGFSLGTRVPPAGYECQSRYVMTGHCKVWVLK